MNGSVHASKGSRSVFETRRKSVSGGTRFTLTEVLCYVSCDMWWHINRSVCDRFGHTRQRWYHSGLPYTWYILVGGVH